MVYDVFSMPSQSEVRWLPCVSTVFLNYRFTLRFGDALIQLFSKPQFDSDDLSGAVEHCLLILKQFPRGNEVAAIVNGSAAPSSGGVLPREGLIRGVPLTTAAHRETPPHGGNNRGQDVGDVGRGRHRGPVEPQPAVPDAREHPVENQRVQMDVEVERPAKALHDDDRAAPGVPRPCVCVHDRTCRCTRPVGTPATAVQRSWRPPRRYRTPGGRLRTPAAPCLRPDVVHEVRGSFGHAPTAARTVRPPGTPARTEPASLAREGDQPLLTAAGTGTARSHPRARGPHRADSARCGGSHPHRRNAWNSSSTNRGSPSPSRSHADSARNDS